MSKKKLEELIIKQNGYITTQDLKHHDIHREYLSMLVKEDKLIRISTGVYQLKQSWEDKLFVYQQKKKHMIYSHDTALYLHGLSDRDPMSYSVTLPTGYNTSQMKEKKLVTHTIKRSLHGLGKMTMVSPFGNDIIVYDSERTICDMIRSRNRMDKQVLHDGLKQYMKGTSKNLNTLFGYAKQMGIEKLLRTYVEMLI